MPESKRRKPKQPSRPQVTSTKAKGPSPRWYAVTMFGLMVAGVLAVLARFVFQLDQYVTIGGLVLIAAGFLMTTSYR